MSEALWARSASRPAGSVLVVEDDENISFVVAAALRLSGLDVTEVRTATGALAELAAGGPPDLIILDVMLPDMDGFEVCGRVRSLYGLVPILFLTARHSVDDRVRGLTAGGDDYLVKPFSIEELMARVRAVLRRSGKAVGVPVLVCGDLVLDDGAHVVRRGNRQVELSPTEYRLLRYLMWNKGRTVARTELLDEVWDYGFGGKTTVVETFISSLRKKVDPGPNRLIHTVHGFGYRLDQVT